MALSVTKILVGGGVALIPISDKAALPISDQIGKAFASAFTVTALIVCVLCVGWYIVRDTIEHIRYTRQRR